MKGLETQIHEVETRIAEGRAAAHRALVACETRLREQTTSWTGLAVLVGAGFVAGRLLRGRHRGQPKSKSGAGLLGIVASLAPALIQAYTRREGRPAESAGRRQAPGRARPEGYLAVEQGRGGPT
jgi:hypothetical protein